eukprot:6482106-Amphidinium_carterae.1
MQHLALLSKGPPGQASGTEFEATVLTPLAGTTIGQPAADIRMLYLKCYSQTLHELRVQVENKDGEGKVLPANEKAIRLRNLAKDYPGVQVDGVYEPSGRLIDAAYQGVQSLAVPYLAWSSCTSRIDESKGQMKASLTNEVVQWMADANGVLRERPHSAKPTTDLSSDLK